jgi:hypothetical protein
MAQTDSSSSMDELSCCSFLHYYEANDKRNGEVALCYYARIHITDYRVCSAKPHTEEEEILFTMFAGYYVLFISFFPLGLFGQNYTKLTVEN